MFGLKQRRHRIVRGLLSPCIDGRLSQKDQRLVEEHLAQCADCRRELEELRDTVHLLHSLPLVPVPRSFALSESQVKAPSGQRTGPPFGALRLATVALVLLLAVVVAGDLWRTSTPAPRQAATSAPQPSTALQASPAPAGAAEGRSAVPAAPQETAGATAKPQIEAAPKAGVADQAATATPSVASTPEPTAAPVVQPQQPRRQETLSGWPLRQMEFALLGLLIVTGAAFVFLRRKPV